MMFHGKDSNRAILVDQHTVQIECGADQREMCKGLREVAQRLALWPGLFRVKPEMIGIAQHPLKQQPGLIEFFGKCLAGAGQRLYQPERAHVESAFLARQSVDAGLRRIAIYQAIAEEAPVAAGLP